jgi:hypothetical protein
VAWVPPPPDPPPAGWWAHRQAVEAQREISEWAEQRAAAKRARRDAARPVWTPSELAALAEARIRRVDDALYDPYARWAPVREDTRPLVFDEATQRWVRGVVDGWA